VVEQIPNRGEFEAFVGRVESKLRIALVAVFGQELGREAAAESLAYGWEHWDRVSKMDNAVGYLYRVGRTSQRRRKEPKWLPAPVDTTPHVEPGLPAALEKLSERQRLAVVLVHAYGWDRADVAGLAQVSVSAVDTHLARGLSKLRTSLGVEAHA
jgi:DNA-directed RNA polymerase specialized sigma24 family protein